MNDALLIDFTVELAAAVNFIKVSRRNGGMVLPPISRVPLLTVHTASPPEAYPSLPDPPKPLPREPLLTGHL